jgi:hypothetical protein
MGRKKLPDCKCFVCARFYADPDAIWESVRRINALDPTTLQGIKDDLVLGAGCDFCGRDTSRAAFVPQIIKDFLRIEYFCTGCRWMLHRTRQQLYWPICYGSTSDDEIRWFLLHFVLDSLRAEIHKLSPAQIAKDKAYQEWLDSLPKFEEEVPDLEISIKPRVRRRNTIIDVEESRSLS